jgi:hypothetical protein
MVPSPRLPDLSLADAGRTFVMRPGSVRSLVVPLGPDAPQVTAGPVTLVAEEPDGGDWAGTVRRYRLEAQAVGTATIRMGEARWQVDIRGPARPAEQTRDDTDAGWGDAGSGHSRDWWEEQRPPHW